MRLFSLTAADLSWQTPGEIFRLKRLEASRPAAAVNAVKLGVARRALLPLVLERLRCHRITLANRDGERRLTEAMPLPHGTSHRLRPPPSLPKSQAEE